MKFSINPAQREQIVKWRDEQDGKWTRREGGKPYYGAIGGAMTYSFTPTSIGVILKVTHANGAVLDVSDYQDW